MLEHTARQLGKLLKRSQVTVITLLLFSLLLVGYAEARKEITLVVDGTSSTVRTMRATVGAVLEQEGIALAPEDSVEPHCDTKLESKMTVKIRRAVPVVLEVAGVVTEAKTAQSTVGQALMDWGVYVGPKDRLNPGAMAPIVPGQKITVVRVEELEATSQVELPYSTQRRHDGSLELGKTKTIQKGAAGLAERRVRRVRENGELVLEEIVAEELLKEPVSEIVAVGTMGTLSRGGIDYRYSRSFDAVATAYCPTDVGGNRTATGIKPRRGVVAVDPRVIPLGSNVYVESYGPALAADTGGAIKGNRVDIFVDSHEEAIRWGRRRVKVYVLK